MSHAEKVFAVAVLAALAWAVAPVAEASHATAWAWFPRRPCIYDKLLTWHSRPRQPGQTVLS